MTRQQDKLTGKNAFLIQDPHARESYTFGEEEYYLCQLMDGVASADEILAKFERYFGESMTEDALQQVAEHVRALGLAERDLHEEPVALSAERISVDGTEVDEDDVSLEDDDEEIRAYHWRLFNPERIYAKALRAFLPFRWVLRTTNYILMFAFPLAIYAFVSEYTAIHHDLVAISSKLAFIGSFLVTLFTLSAMRATAEGLVCAHFGARISQFGFRLHAGCIPRFWVDRSRVTYASRTAKLWIYSASPILKMYLITIGVASWYIFHGTGTSMAALITVVFHVALVELVVISLPVIKADGYRWMVTFFNLHPKVMDHAVRVTVSYLIGKPLVSNITPKQRTFYCIYGSALLICWVIFIFRLTGTIGKGFAITFPGIFGQLTGWGISLIVFFFVARWGSMRFIKPFLSKERIKEIKAETVRRRKGIADAETLSAEQRKSRRIKYSLLAAAILLTIIPYPYRLGGEIEILPPREQQIQAPISGKVEKTYFIGGDGTRIPQGALVAQMTFSEIENALLVLGRQSEEKQAMFAKAKSALAKLLAGARPEEVDRGKALLSEATEEVDVANAELLSAKVASAFADQQLKTIQGLFEKGVFSRLQLDEAKSKSDLATIEIDRKQKNLAAKQGGKARAQAHLDLIVAGARAEDIEAARQECEGAQAELGRIEQQLIYTRKQQAEGELRMPFDGYLIEPRLDRKVGAYLKIGEVFASAQDHAQQLVVVDLPEYEAGEVRVGSTAQIKLFAYSNDPLRGKVISVEPASTQKPTLTGGRVFEVLIELEKPPVAVKPGMSGYGKIDAGWKPLSLILIRPVIRFFQVEVWSWMP